MAKRFFGVGELNPSNTTGTWAQVTASNVTTFNHTAGDDTSILDFVVPTASGYLGFDRQPIKAIKVQYTVATAALDAAATAVLNKITVNDTTGVVTRAAVTQTLTFEGTDTTGTAAGTFFAVITPATPLTPDEGEYYTVELTFNAAATTVLKVADVQIETT